MPRREGLRPIGDSVKKIIEKIRKEREERQNRNKPVRTQPKLPGMKKGGDVKGYMSGGFGIFSKKKAKADEPDKKESQAEKKKRRLEELKKEMGMKDGGKVKKREGGRGRKPRPRLGVPGLPERPRPTPRPGPPGRKPPRKKQDNSDRPKGFELKYPDRPSSPGNPVVVYSVKTGALIGGQKKLDANKDGKISGDDFKILRGKNNKMKGGGIAIRGTNFKGVY
jgi:hypothetical protein